jgi:predicted dehydrogenase
MMMSERETLNRRRFLGVGGAALAAPWFVPASARGANDRITLGFIGLGRMGEGHVRRLVPGHNDVQAVAVCDVHRKFRDRAASMIEEGYAERSGRSGYKGCDRYNDFRELVRREDIDAVLIAVPDHWHAIIASEAARHGKDIYCEKPLTLTIHEARELIRTVRRHDRVFQTGSQQRSSSRFRRACELVRNGYLGDLKTIHIGIGGTSEWCDLSAEPVPDGLDWDLWLGPAPERPFNPTLRPPHNETFPRWRDYREFSGGSMTDWGAHHFDIAQWALGMDESGPVEVHPPSEAESGHLTYRYADGVEMYHHMPEDMPSGNGVLFTGTEGKLFVNRSTLKSWPGSIAEQRIGPGDTALYRSPGHHRDWLDCIRERRRPICDVSVGAHSVTVCHVGNLCYWLDRSLKWDPAAWRFEADATANRMRHRARREPWTHG